MSKCESAAGGFTPYLKCLGFRALAHILNVKIKLLLYSGTTQFFSDLDAG
jgi:hypothetical protein